MPAVPGRGPVDTRTVANLRQLRGADGGQLYSKLVALFETGSTATLSALDGALASAELPMAAALCHKLKASAANVGALTFSRELGRLEKACQTRNLAEAQHLHARVRSAHPALLAELANLTLRASA